MELLDGKRVAAIVKKHVAEEVNKWVGKTARPPRLVAILVGKDGASETYVNNKVKACGECGIQSTVLHLEATVSTADILEYVKGYNNSDSVDGIIVQLPLPEHVDTRKVINAIDPKKDVDGIHPYNMGLLHTDKPYTTPATPLGILMLLAHYGICTDGKKVVIIGRSDIVGRPMANLMSSKYCNATVTLVHSQSIDIEKETQTADILISAIGKPGFVKADMVKEGAVVIDVGTTRVEDDTKKNGWRLAGDVDFVNVAPKCKFISPVPGGVGPMTIASLMQNTLKCYKNNINSL